jgi:hypothetical protein
MFALGQEETSTVPFAWTNRLVIVRKLARIRVLPAVRSITGLGSSGQLVGVQAARDEGI